MSTVTDVVEPLCSGREDRDRTCDLMLPKHALYHLSYFPKLVAASFIRPFALGIPGCQLFSPHPTLALRGVYKKQGWRKPHCKYGALDRIRTCISLSHIQLPLSSFVARGVTRALNGGGSRNRTGVRVAYETPGDPTLSPQLGTAYAVIYGADIQDRTGDPWVEARYVTSTPCPRNLVGVVGVEPTLFTTWDRIYSPEQNTPYLQHTR